MEEENECSIDALTEDQFYDDFFDALSDNNELVEILDFDTDKELIDNSIKYTKKPFMTKTEYNFYQKLISVFGDKYIIQPQVNLATIINKESNYTYQNELFRNIDFGIFSKDKYELLLLIELNDESHLKLDRQIRDIKVESICRKAGYNLIKFWANKPNELYYMNERIKKNICYIN